MITKSFSTYYSPGKGYIISFAIDGIENTMEILIERAEGPEGPWKEVGVAAWNDVSFTDELEKRIKGFAKTVWHRLTVRDIDTPSNIHLETKPSNTVAPSKAESEILRQHNIALYGDIKRPGYFVANLACYKQIKFEERVCDVVTWHGDPIFSDDTNQGLKTVEGWSNPIKFNGRWLDQVSIDEGINDFGVFEQQNRQLWTSNYPIIEVGDIIVEKGTGKSYSVLSTSSSEPNNYVLHQNIMVTQINHKTYEAQNLKYPGDQ